MTNYLEDFVLEELSDRDATVVNLLFYDGTKISASARRAPGDEPDEITGVLLATARAYNKLAHKLAKQADARVNHASEIKRHREERKAQKADQADYFSEINKAAANLGQYLQESLERAFNRD